MPTNGEDRANDAHPADPVPGIGTAYAVDTSVAIAALDGAHTAHEPCLDAVRRLRPALAGQAEFETYSVLTRMPGSLAVDSATASRLIKRVFPTTLWLSPEHASALLARLGVVGIRGGSTYDALVGEAALRYRHTLLTRDRRALRTYDLLGVTYHVVGD